MAVSIPKWFDWNAYLNNKLATMPSGTTMSSLVSAMDKAGFVGEEGSYRHFLQFGHAENVSPSAGFDANQYFTFKAAQTYHSGNVSAVTAAEAATIKQLIADAGMDAWTHYQKYGTVEMINASNSFDTAAYLQAKSVAMGGSMSAAQVADAIQKAGMNAYEHYMQFKGGAGEVATTATYVVDPSKQASNPGQTFTLTDSTVGSGKADNLTGTSGNDLFDARLIGSLETGDVLSGGEGTDKLEARIKAAGVTPTVTGIEELYVQATNTGSIDLSKASGYTQAWTQDNANGFDLTWNNVAAGTVVGLKNIARDAVNANETTVTVNYAAAAANVTVAVDGVGVGTAGARPDLTINGGTNVLTVNATGANSRLSTLDVKTLDGTTNTLDKLVVTGDKQFRVEDALGFDANTTVGEIDASASTGGVNLNVSGGARNITFTGGAAADRIAFGNTLTVLDKAVGGEGKDTIAVASDVEANQQNLQVSGFEVLEVAALAANLNMARIGATELVITGDQDANVAVTNLGDSGKATFQMGGNNAGAGVVDLQVKDATVAGTNNTFALELSHGGVNSSQAGVTVNGVENLTINSVKQAATLNDATNTLTTLTDNQLDVLTITGDQNLTITNGIYNNTRTVNAADFTGDLNLTVAVGNTARGVTINSGSGNDRLTGGSGADAINGGAGNDRIQGDQGVTVVAAPQQSPFTVGAVVDTGDIYTLTVDNIAYSHTATVGQTAANVATALANLVAGAADGNDAKGITASATGAVVTVTGNAGVSFTAAGAATNAVATAQVTTLDFGAINFDAGDNISITIVDANIASQAITTGNLAAVTTPIQAAAAFATALNANGILQGAGITAVATGNDVVITGNANGLAFTTTIAAGGVTEAAATPDVETTTFVSTSAADVITATVNGQSLQWISSGTLATDATTLTNLVNANATLAGQGVTAVAAGAAVTLTDAQGQDIVQAFTINGVAALPAQLTIAETTTGVVVSDNAVTQQSSTAGFDAGADNTQSLALGTVVPAVTQVGGAAAADTLTGGAGQDLFVFGAGHSGTPGATITNIDTITDLNFGAATNAGTIDTLQFAGVGASGTNNAITLVNGGVAQAMSTAATLTLAVNALFDTGAALDVTAAGGKAGLFTYGADTYLVVAGTTDTAAFGADDFIVKVTGVTGTMDATDFI